MCACGGVDFGQTLFLEHEISSSPSFLSEIRFWANFPRDIQNLALTGAFTNSSETKSEFTSFLYPLVQDRIGSICLLLRRLWSLISQKEMIMEFND